MSLLSIFSPTGVKSSVWVNLVMIGTEELFFRQERILSLIHIFISRSSRQPRCWIP